MKRLMDILASATLLVLLCPIMVGLALWIRWKDGAPVLFRQERIGRNGVPFDIFKFRTMRLQQAGDLAVTSGDGDERITSTGKRMRSRRLDEFPQLWNVLKGDMSFVGPRPEVASYVDVQSEVWKSVLSVRPGITGPDALAFRNEGELLSQVPDADQHYRDTLLPQKLAIQVDYVANRTLAGDLAILFRTLGVLRG
ncbi:MAG: sugar transferase [Flavobacteriales bacterium]|nr:sugar transferase [Flavobacteriales bacterium]